MNKTILSLILFFISSIAVAETTPKIKVGLGAILSGDLAVYGEGDLQAR